jgi:hypothetical protein
MHNQLKSFNYKIYRISKNVFDIIKKPLYSFIKPVNIELSINSNTTTFIILETILHLIKYKP